MADAKRRAIDAKVRNSMRIPKGTFGTVGTGRLGQTRKSLPSATLGPNLRTANRADRRKSSVGLLSSANSGEGADFVSARTKNLFKKTIDYDAQKGNACDERLAELIK